MRIGICASYQQVAALDSISFDYLEESVQRFLLPEQPHEQFEQQLHRARLLPLPIEAANVLLPSGLKLVATPSQQVDQARLERYIRTVLRRAEQAGIRVIVFGSGAARACPPDGERADAERQVGEHLARWGEWARQHGVTFALEPLRYEETNILNTVVESGALIARIGAPGARLLADTYHMACNDEPPAGLAGLAPLLAHVHVAERQDRAAPGTHGEDFRPYLRAMRRGGYDARISIECRWGDFAAEVAPAVAVLRGQWQAAAAT
ncbi:MAG TPA: sugar phosphate isomerase/epimerase family protein [Chloroflexota bacterium]|nr:sugar phosphate isomerase/epimerase family protein [Chloroflexota bacterium]